jgi:hypothetical protein
VQPVRAVRLRDGAVRRAVPYSWRREQRAVQREQLHGTAAVELRAAMDTLQRLGRRVESLLYFDEMVTMAEPQHVKLSAITEATEAAANIRQLLRDYYIQSGIATRHVSAYEIAPVNRELAWAQETFLALVNQYVTHISNMALHKANCHAHLSEHK